MFRTVVIERFGTFLGKRGERLVLRGPAGGALKDRGGPADDGSSSDREVGKREEEEIPLFRIGEIVLPARGVTISTDLVEEVVRRGIPMTFVTTRGQPYAMLTSPMLTATIATRRAQLRAMDNVRGAELARSFVAGKLRNQASLLIYFAKALRNEGKDGARPSLPSTPETSALDEDARADAEEDAPLEPLAGANELGQPLACADQPESEEGADPLDADCSAEQDSSTSTEPQTPDATGRRTRVLRAASEVRAARKGVLSVDASSKPDFIRETLMGFEGIGAKAYWRGVRSLLEGRVVFEGRGHRGATDPANALLNYGYGILSSRIWGALLHAGLDPFAGMLHADRSGKPSLVLDLMEEFRAPAVDRAVLSHLRLGKRARFAGSFLDEETRRTIADAVLQRLEARVTVAGERLQLASIIQRQARAIASHVRGEESYRSFAMTW